MAEVVSESKLGPVDLFGAHRDGTDPFDGAAMTVADRARLLMRMFPEDEEVTFPGTGNRAADFMLSRYLEGILLRTAFAALHSQDALTKILEGRAVLVPPDEHVLTFFPSPIQRFLRTCEEQQVPVALWWHFQSNEKVDIGYKPHEVAITLAYAKDEAATAFFVFCREDQERIPRSVIKPRIGGLKDLTKAAAQAEQNLSGIMVRGAVGPFPAGASDRIYVDKASLENYGAAPVNFSAGLDRFSFQIQLSQAIEVLHQLYPARVEIVDLFPVIES